MTEGKLKQAITKGELNEAVTKGKLNEAITKGKLKETINLTDWLINLNQPLDWGVFQSNKAENRSFGGGGGHAESDSEA